MERRESTVPRPESWNLRPPNPDALPVVAEAMLPGVYPVGSQMRDWFAYGGFGPCDNYSISLRDQKWGAPGQVSLVAFPEETVAYFKHQGLALRVINRGWWTASFEAVDSQLRLVREARDPDGTWREIESGPFEICGNSYHRVFLPSGQCWEVPARVYSGPLQTTLRFRLDPGPGVASIYSNEFDGQISPAQFETKKANVEKPAPGVAARPGA